LYGQLLMVQLKNGLMILRFGEHRRGYSVNF
jgi:hypothetical protein